MAYWITLRKGKMRQGFQAATAREALSVLLEKHGEGYEEVRIIHPDGYEVSKYGLILAIENGNSEAVRNTYT